MQRVQNLHGGQTGLIQKIENMVNAIVGFELKVERWEGKEKVGQNRSTENQASLKRNLETSVDPAYQFLAKQMKTS